VLIPEQICSAQPQLERRQGFVVPRGREQAQQHKVERGKAGVAWRKKRLAGARERNLIQKGNIIIRGGGRRRLAGRGTRRGPGGKPNTEGGGVNRLAPLLSVPSACVLVSPLYYRPSVNSIRRAPARLRQPEPRMRLAVRGVPKGAVRKHSA